jgi:hypothetical protein
MGSLYYGDTDVPVRIDDRTLAHLKVAIVTKLRRRESFMLTCSAGEEDPGRTALWMHPAVPLRFVFDEPEPPVLDRKRVAMLLTSANSIGGITLEPEQVSPRS